MLPILLTCGSGLSTHRDKHLTSEFEPAVCGCEQATSNMLLSFSFKELIV